MSASLEIASFRFLVYDLFSSLLLYNFYDEDYKTMLNKLEKLSSLEADVIDIRRIRDKVKSITKSDLLIEYTTLFMTGTGVKPLTPVESKRVFSVMGESVAQFKYNDVLRFYRSRNVKIGYDLGVFTPEPDHAATILAFMAYLVKEEIELRSKGVKDLFRNKTDQKNFFTSHIDSWMPDWINDVINDPRSNVYKVVCEELRKWIDFEREYLKGERN